MNPRQRRWLIPGLLIALIVVVVVASIAGKAGAATPTKPILRLTDPDIVESSGLAVGPDGLGYTINDSGNAFVVYVFRLSDGEVVGRTRVDAPGVDTEAMTIAGDTLWIGDTGTNGQSDPHQALLAIDLPKPGDRTVTARRYPITVPGNADTEALLASPKGELYLVTKLFGSGTAYRVDPRAGTVSKVATGMPSLVTDGAFSPDGRRIALLTYFSVVWLDPSTWRRVGEQDLPPLDQAETLAFRGNDHILVGSEGKDSPLYQLDVPRESASPSPAQSSSVQSSPAQSTSTPSPDDATSAAAAIDRSTDDATRFVGWFAGGVAVLVLVGASAVAVGRVRRSR